MTANSTDPERGIVGSDATAGNPSAGTELTATSRQLSAKGHSLAKHDAYGDGAGDHGHAAADHEADANCGCEGLMDEVAIPAKKTAAEASASVQPHMKRGHDHFHHLHAHEDGCAGTHRK